jgi:CBS domain-containing protein
MRIHDEWDALLEQARSTDALSSLRASVIAQMRTTVRANAHMPWCVRGGAPMDGYERMHVWHDIVMQRVVGQTHAFLCGQSTVAFFVVGSAGRQEMTVHSDQDNGLIIGEDVDGAVLGQRVCDALYAHGYDLCEGRVLACEPEWCMTPDQWCAHIATRMNSQDFFALRQLLVLADARTVYGDDAACTSMKRMLMHALARDKDVWPRLLTNTMRYKLLFGLMGNLLTERYGTDAGGIDIKYGVYLPFVSAIRLLALWFCIEETSTLKRMRALRNALPDEWAAHVDDWQAAFCDVLRLREMAALGSGIAHASKMLPADLLTKDVKPVLRDIVRIGRQLQKVVAKFILRREHR